MPLTRINNLGITDGTIVNADIATAAAIATSKLGVGAIRQVSSVATTNATQTISTTTYTDLTSLSLSITPSSTSSKILLIANINIDLEHDEGIGIKFFRDATNIYTTKQIYSIYNYGTVGDQIYITAPYVYLDSPSTTSAITYKIQGATYGSRSVDFNKTMESIFYAMEIAG